jgi:transposase
MWAATSCSWIPPGDTVPVIVDRLTGEVRQAQIFVAVRASSE